MDFLIAMAPQGDGGGNQWISTLIMFGAIFAIFYFMIIRPQQKRAKERESMLSAMKKGDKVITSGGLHGTIHGLDDKTALLEIASGVKVKVERASIASVNEKSVEAAK